MDCRRSDARCRGPVAAVGWLLVAAAVWLTSCAKPSEEECRKACLHHSKLFLDDKWADKLAAAPSETERQALEQAKEAEWQEVQTEPERGIHACIAACNRPGRGAVVECILAAKTLAESRACED